MLQQNPLQTEGVLLHQFQSNQLLPLLSEAENMLHSPELYNDANETLGGHLEREYGLSPKSHDYLESLVLPFVDSYKEIYPGCEEKYSILTEPRPHTLSVSWCNFQKKYEFNPVHNHSGIYSFVIWLKVPYLIEDEINQPWCKRANTKCAGHFEIYFQDTLGSLRTERIPADKTYENHMLFFPAWMYHSVYPFYTSDDYRISISGNICLKV